MVKLWGVNHDQLDKVWDKVKPLLKRVKGVDLKDTYNRLKARELQLWCAFGQKIDCALVTEIYTEDDLKVCDLLYCGGDNRKSWLHFIKTVEEWALSLGCDVCRIKGRKGWSRVLDYSVISQEGNDYLYEKVI